MGFLADMFDNIRFTVEEVVDNVRDKAEEVVDNARDKAVELGYIIHDAKRDFKENVMGISGDDDPFDVIDTPRIPPIPGPFPRLPIPTKKRVPGRGIESLFNEEVFPVEGSIVCCRLGGALDHSGVYVGDDLIIHRDGDGYIAEVSPRTFIERLDGWNPAINIFVSCRGNEPVGSDDVADRARECLDDPGESGYNILFKNCHQFCHYCLTGERASFPSFSSLEVTTKRVLGMNRWRSWHLPGLFD